MSRINRRRAITASEIGDFAYCPKAWYLKRCGEAPQNAHLDEGVAFHERHGSGVSQAARLNQVGKKFVVIALILFIVAAIVWLVMEEAG
jgi:hypothetical protein